MSMLVEERLSDSPYVEKVMHGHTLGDGSSIRPSEIHWHLVIVRVKGIVLPLTVGPQTASGVAAWGADAEILWIKFKLGAFMPHLPVRNYIDSETLLPEAASNNAFWLKGSAWQLPTFENADTFIDRLAHQELLVRDPVVSAALEDQYIEIPSRTVRHRFLRATGLTQGHIRQYQRARQAAALLEQGMPILDTVFEAGYFDQSHLTRSLRKFIGKTPAQLLPLTATPYHSVPDTEPLVADHVNTLLASR